jgi:hypothetical protein
MKAAIFEKPGLENLKTPLQPSPCNQIKFKAVQFEIPL